MSEKIKRSEKNKYIYQDLSESEKNINTLDDAVNKIDPVIYNNLENQFDTFEYEKDGKEKSKIDTNENSEFKKILKDLKTIEHKISHADPITIVSLPKKEKDAGKNYDKMEKRTIENEINYYEDIKKVFHFRNELKKNIIIPTSRRLEKILLFTLYSIFLSGIVYLLLKNYYI